MEGALELARRGLACAYVPSTVVRLHNQQVRPERALEPVRAAAHARSARVPHVVAPSSEVGQPEVHRLLAALNAVLAPVPHSPT